MKAVVQPMPGVQPGPELVEELIAFCGEHLSRQKVPARSTSRTSCRACPPASSTSAYCAIGIGLTTRAGSSETGSLSSINRGRTGQILETGSLGIRPPGCSDASGH